MIDRVGDCGCSADEADLADALNAERIDDLVRLSPDGARLAFDI